MAAKDQKEMDAWIKKVDDAGKKAVERANQRKQEQAKAEADKAAATSEKKEEKKEEKKKESKDSDDDGKDKKVCWSDWFTNFCPEFIWSTQMSNCIVCI